MGQKRVALVIGNSVYKHAGKLRNPNKDAHDVSGALARLDFVNSKPKIDLTCSQLLRALQDFRARADRAEMAVIYFAGHGIEVGGSNFLIPVDAKLQRASDVEYEAVALNQVLTATDGAHQLRLIILDACRDNPFRARMISSATSRSIGRGFSDIEPRGNMLVAYAAKHGTFAQDGKGSNSPFASAILKHIEKPGIEVAQLFREVRDDVLEFTNGEQEPHLYGTLGRKSIFLKSAAHAQYPAVEQGPSALLAGGSSAPPTPIWHTAAIGGVALSGLAIAMALLLPPNSPSCSSADWNVVEHRRNIDALQKFAVDCSHTHLAVYAREELERRDTADAAEAHKTQSEDAYRRYLSTWENQKPYQGKFAAEATAAIARINSSKLSFSQQPANKAVDMARALRPPDLRARADDAAIAAAKEADPRIPPTHGVGALRIELAKRDFVEVMIGLKNEVRWIRAGGGKSDTETFKDCGDCPSMVVVPMGKFEMGSPDTEEGRDENEGPQQTISIDEPFAAGRFEVTFAEWDACAAAGVCRQRPETDWGRGNEPVIKVNWNEINTEFLPWLSRISGKKYKLLTASQWEYVARAGTNGPFSFSGNIDSNKVNYDGRYQYAGSAVGNFLYKTIPVNSLIANGWGIYGVHGNVWEWVQDCYTDSLKDTPKNGTAVEVTFGCRRVIRGGAWSSDPRWVRSAARDSIEASARDRTVGFRVARALGAEVSAASEK